MKNFNNFKLIFSFTFIQQMRAKSFRVTTVLVALIFLILPAAIMPLIESSSGGESEQTGEFFTNAKTVFIADMSTGEPADMSILSSLSIVLPNIEYINCKDFDEAVSNAGKTADSLVLVIEDSEDGYDASVLLPDETELTDSDAEGVSNIVSNYFPLILYTKSGISAPQLAEIYTPTDIESTEEIIDDAETEEDPYAGVKTALSFILPYANVMLIYFLVLFYGQGVANSVIIEKTSKLMDTFLTSVKPEAMVFGKVFAIVLASITQLAIWLATLVGGFAAGTYFVKMINPDTTMTFVAFIDNLGSFSDIFTPGGIIVSLLMIFAGFLLYCAVSAIGGSAAGKQEDLASTNVMFSLILVASFLSVLWSGAINGEMTSGLMWYDIVPFTSILITPSRILLGYVSIGTGLLSLAVVLASCCILLVISGRVYKMMSLYKGNPPTPARLFKMLRSKT